MRVYTYRPARPQLDAASQNVPAPANHIYYVGTWDKITPKAFAPTLERKL